MVFIQVDRAQIQESMEVNPVVTRSPFRDLAGALSEPTSSLRFKFTFGFRSVHVQLSQIWLVPLLPS